MGEAAWRRVARPPRRGRLLVATPSLAGPEFARTVVLLLEHGPSGALGVVLNRPSEVTLASVLPDWRGAASHPPVVFAGGPVETSALLALGAPAGDDGEVAVLPGIAPVDLRGGGSGGGRVRVFAGYAGWSPRQVESEVDGGGWFVVDGTADDVTTPEPEHLWRAVLTRAGGVYTTATPDPGRN